MRAERVRVPESGRAPAWAGQLQSAVGLALILTGIAGLAYPLLLTVLAHLAVPPQVQAGVVVQEGTSPGPAGQSLSGPQDRAPQAPAPPAAGAAKSSRLRRAARASGSGIRQPAVSPPPQHSPGAV
jgi:hypothetical protein